jgi:two-component system response regulator AtoC
MVENKILENTDFMHTYLADLTLRQAEKLTIEACLAKYKGRQKDMAEKLGISERGLYNKLQEYGLLREK